MTSASLSALLATAAGCSGANGALIATADGAAESVSSSSPSAAAIGLSDGGIDATLTDGLSDAGGDAADVVETGPPSLCTGIQVCDDFETTAVGAAPNPSLWTVGAPNCVGRGTAVVDDSMAYTGRHSVKVVNDFGDGGPPQYCDHVFFSNESAFAVAGAEQVYTRFFVTLGEPLAMTHATFSTMTNTAESAQLRFGFDDGVLSWNNASTGAFLPELQSGPVTNAASDPIDVMESLAPPGGWFCVEFHIDEEAGTYETWIESMEVPGLEFDGSAVTNISTQWAMDTSKPLLSNLGFGWETYFSMPMILWFDDVAIDTKRIGCTPQDQ
ncbi:MAG TPA: hypothetical protein VEK07_06235 [Polyangiaceae bacterium]|nr:hypothetical protein [Polyangiaceae bacterium]